jgi:predicted O-methyltransferase YrrM
MNFTKLTIEKLISTIGKKKINRFLSRNDIKFEIARQGASHYRYYWQSALKNKDLREYTNFWHLATNIIQEKRTFLKYDRLFTFWQILMRLPFADDPIVEIGTYRGGSAKFLFHAIKQFNLNCPLYVFDTFEGHVNVNEDLDGRHTIGCFNDTTYEDVKKYIDAPEISIIPGDFCETAEQIGQFDNFGLVHIDVDVYPVTKFCLEFFKPRTKPGSVIVIDDYGNNACEGLKKAVDEFAQESACFSMHYLLTGQALLTRLK